MWGILRGLGIDGFKLGFINLGNFLYFMEDVGDLADILLDL